LEQSAGEGEALPASTLRRLRDYYLLSGETHRALELARALEDLHAADLAILRDALEGHAGGTGRRPSPRSDAAAVDEAGLPETSAAPLPQPPAIQVGAGEEADIRDAVRELFGFPDLRPGQLETIAAVRRGQDVLTVMPTGAGKSLCYQMPAFRDTAGVTLVISPLIALMKDQLDSLPPPLRALATTINSTLDGDSLRQCSNDVAAGRYRLVYAAPERLRQPPFLHALRRAGVNRLVVDEAHCISIWGHDFRPDYLFIGRARHDLGDPPLLAMTATAPARVRQDILRRMSRDDSAEGREMMVVLTEPCRPNLTLEAIPVANHDERLRRLIALCQSIPGNGIVYADTRRRCEELAAMLRGRGLDAAHYHAGIEDPAERAAVQEAFIAGEVRIIVATIAFGMGIDKADIRFVIHYQLPNSVESYYQEAGRAGRDGLPARCLLFHSPSDRATLTRRFRREALTIDLLRAAYAAIRRQMRGEALGRLSLDELAREVEFDSTTARVALSMLEESGLLRRHYDVPRMAVIRLRDRAGTPRSPEDGERLARLLASSRQARDRTLTLDPLSLARDCGLDPRDWETHALRWAEAGWISYRPSGRDPLIELLPADRHRTGAAVAAVLDRYVSIQLQRIDEIAAYAQTRRCRHDYLSRYLGGDPARNGSSCTACDNCVPATSPSPTGDGALPDETEQLQTVLRCIAESPWGWGAMTLRRILRAERDAAADRHQSPHRGALAFRSQQAVEQMIAALQAAGMLAARTLDHGGAALQLTDAGRNAIADPSRLGHLAPGAVPPVAGWAQGRRAAGVGAEDHPEALDLTLSPDDEALFQRLRRWRMAVAQEAGTAPFIIAHDSVLRRIAAARPTTAEELLAIHGIGPAKVQRYGQAILDVVRDA
jgi:ATP-dependent DNA helicase RecQ